MRSYTTFVITIYATATVAECEDFMKNFPLSDLQLLEIIKKFPTPFHIYDERTIRSNYQRLLNAFNWVPFKEYFAVKATPNPKIVKLLADDGAGADCSSLPELLIANMAGLTGKNIIMTSNDTPIEEFEEALKLDAIINLDDISHLDFLAKNVKLPEMLCFRYNPADISNEGNDIIGKPAEAKYGLTRKQIFEAYKSATELGVKRFGLHTMVASNELYTQIFLTTAEIMFNLAVEIKHKLDIELEFINLGGGIGIPYRLDQKPVDLEAVGKGIHKLYDEILVKNNLRPSLAMESGRAITGNAGWLVSTVRHLKHTYKNYVGLDSCMADLMRPALYGAYHHISVVGKENKPLDYIYDVTGSLCENNDKFAIDRELPKIDVGDILIIHDTGAHGHAMGFNYNGKLRHAELLLRENGEVEMIRRAETIDDYFATLNLES